MSFKSIKKGLEVGPKNDLIKYTQFCKYGIYSVYNTFNNENPLWKLAIMRFSSKILYSKSSLRGLKMNNMNKIDHKIPQPRDKFLWEKSDQVLLDFLALRATLFWTTTFCVRLLIFCWSLTARSRKFSPLSLRSRLGKFYEPCSLFQHQPLHRPRSFQPNIINPNPNKLFRGG